MRSVFGLVLATAMGLMTVPEARACWDGSLTTVGRVTIQGGDDRWDPARAVELARWLTRIDRLLPAGASFESWDGARLTLGDETIEIERYRGLADLYHRIARAARVSWTREALVRGFPAPRLWTIQAGSFPTEAAARARARQIDEGASCSQGFYEAGGFPANNPATHLERSPDGRVFRVLIGAYLDRASAEEALGCLAEVEDPNGGRDSYAITGYVRHLVRPTAVAAAPPADPGALR